MGDDWDVDFDAPTFRPFTREEKEIIENRIFEKRLMEKKKADKRAKNIAEFGEGARARKLYSHDSDDEDPEFSVPAEPQSKLEQGNDLPRIYSGDFPLELASTPICDIDPHYKDKLTFMVISKGGSIYRFSATNALLCLSPFHPIRRIAIMVLTHQMFSVLVIITILVNSVVMVQDETEYTAATEIIFTAIYTYESAIKLLARGLVFCPFSYLRDGWNWLDFSVIVMSYVTIAIDLGSFSALRTFRVFRALKSVAVIPGLKTIVSAIIYSVKNLRDVIILTIFLLAVFALLGLQIYMGVLSQICIRDLELPTDHNMTERQVAEEWDKWTRNGTNWLISELTNTYILCGNSSGAGLCPEYSTCIAVKQSFHTV